MALNILSINEIKRFLEDKQLYVVSKETGISYPTLAKFSFKKPHNFTLATLVKMTAYIKKESKPLVKPVQTLTEDDL